MKSFDRTEQARRALRDTRPTNRDELHDHVAAFYRINKRKVKIPRVAVCPGHQAPFDYVANSYFGQHRNAIVCANRGGGKTVCGAITKHLRMMFNPGCGVRVLGGSKAQSKQMFNIIRGFDSAGFSDIVDGEPLMEMTRYRNGSHIKILLHSGTEVRGPHEPEVAFDEVDEFKEEIYKAALAIAQTQGKLVARLEQFSTLHKPYGLMADAIETAEIPESNIAIYRWCVWEVVKRCCDTCSIEHPNERCAKLAKFDTTGKEIRFSDLCGCKAQRADGYYSLDDLRDKFMQMPLDTFRVEMLCEHPKTDDMIYPSLDLNFHELPKDYIDSKSPLLLGFDYGMNNNYAVWARARSCDGSIVTVGELYPQRNMDSRAFAALVASEQERLGLGVGTVLAAFLPHDAGELISALNSPGIRERIFVAPVAGTRIGMAMHYTTGVPQEAVVLRGYQAIRTRLQKRRDANGVITAGLFFSPRCRTLIRQMVKLHSDKTSTGVLTGMQEKVNDHGPDALRYLVHGWEAQKHNLLSRGTNSSRVELL